MTTKIENMPPEDLRIVGSWSIIGGDYQLTDEYRADGTVVQHVGGRTSKPKRFQIDGEILTCFVEQPDGRIFEQKARFGISEDTLTFYDSPRTKRIFRRTQAAQPVAGTNRRGRCGCNPRHESAVAQLFSFGGGGVPHDEPPGD